MRKRKHSVFYYLLLLLAATLSFSNCHTNPAGPGLSIFNIYHNKILFTSSRSGNPQLYMMNPDGTNVIQLTSGSDSGGEFGKWTPDASIIAYNYYSRNAYYEVPPFYVMTPSGLNRHLVGYGEQMSWSPDGSKIISSGFHIPMYITDVNSGISERTPLWGGAPDWSPDGKYIVYCYTKDSSNQIKSYNEIVKYPSYDSVKTVGPNTACYLAWSRDGKYFAYSDYDGNIYTMNTNGSNIKKITDNKTQMEFLYPRWSSNNQTLIFIASTTDGSHKSYLYMVNVDGTNLHRVIDDSIVTSADWSR